MRRITALLILAAGLAALAPATGRAATASAAAQTYKSCPAPPPPFAYPTTGGSYSAFSAKGTNCKTAYKVGLAFTRCRLANGRTGRCVRKVLGFACVEQRQTDPTGGIRGSVTCRKGTASVRHRYEQSAA